MAQSDLRALMTNASASTGGEPARDHQNRLVVEMGTIQVMEKLPPPVEERDQAAFDELKNMI